MGVSKVKDNPHNEASNKITALPQRALLFVRSLKQNMEAIEKVISYLWQDEANDWASEEHRKVSEHIFNHLVEAKLYVFNTTHSSQARPRDYMYAESPFDLASDEDNDYRNLVDSLFGN